jgi:hypothetical protein
LPTWLACSMRSHALKTISRVRFGNTIAFVVPVVFSRILSSSSHSFTHVDDMGL